MRFVVLTCISIIALLGGMMTEGARTMLSSAPYSQWKYGPPSGPDYFPVAVWLQDPKNAKKFQGAGINLYVGLWKGPTEAQLSALKAAGMPVICEQNRIGLAHRSDPTIIGWMHGDEPDNAQPITDPQTGREGYGPPIAPQKIVDDYEKLRKADTTRPILLNLGQGVANDEWVGRGPNAHKDDYLTYVKGCDVVSFDVYPVAGIDKDDGENYLWYVPKGVDRLAQWSKGKKIIWNCIECTRISNLKAKPTPHQVRAEVWMSIIHGSRGLIYFVHQFQPRFIEPALLEDPEMLAAVTKINRQIHDLAPVINSPTMKGGVSVKSSSQHVPIDIMIKRFRRATYVFAVDIRNEPTKGSFAISGIPKNSTVDVLEENRKIEVRDGRFEDTFAPYDVHIYRAG